MKKNAKKKRSFRTQINNLAYLAQHPYSFVVTSRNPKGQACRKIKKHDICFCGHIIGEHLEKGDGLSCQHKDCQCVSFCYLPSISIKCICKHSPLRHDSISHQCNQCSCLGFATNWTCNCGCKLLEHCCTKQIIDNSGALQAMSSADLPELKPSNKKSNKAMRVLPAIKKPKGIINYPASDSIKQNLNLSHISKVRAGDVFTQKQNVENSYLKEKLIQANLRYFSKFKELENNGTELYEKISENTALNLFVQPHFYRSCSLTALNHKYMQQT